MTAITGLFYAFTAVLLFILLILQVYRVRASHTHTLEAKLLMSPARQVARSALAGAPVSVVRMVYPVHSLRLDQLPVRNLTCILLANMNTTDASCISKIELWPDILITMLAKYLDRRTVHLTLASI